MHNKQICGLLKAKSFTSMYEIFGPAPFNNILYKNPDSGEKELSVFQTTCLDMDGKNDNPLITKEDYYGLNQKPSSKVFESTSTLYCDLDDVAKRHSFHCITSLSLSNANVMKVMELPINTQFLKQSNAIVQECATKVYPNLYTSVPNTFQRKETDSFGKKPTEGYSLSSEIFLKDNRYDEFNSPKSVNKDSSNREQKYWSYLKYRTEYAKKKPEDKGMKKRDRGKRIEDPCPCQLFSYACPCSDRKSLTEFENDPRTVTVADQVTSTAVFKQIKEDSKMCKKKTVKDSTMRLDKHITTSIHENCEKTYSSVTNNDKNFQEIPRITEKLKNPSKINSNPKQFSSNRNKLQKKHRIICPNCKEKIEVSIQSEDDEMSHVLSKTSLCEESPVYINKIVEDREICNHEPPCELVPCCQILTNEEYCIPKSPTKRRNSKTSKVIRITKACRHHPPCTVVPSCQRLNVIANKNDYIPPCLHRPRCVNLPICTPFSKNLYDNSGTKHKESSEHCPKRKYIPENKYEVAEKHQINMIPKVPMAFVQSKDFVSPNKSFRTESQYCQYNFVDLCCNDSAITECSTDTLVFIRDVGCQFQAKKSAQRTSPKYKSSTSFDFVDVKMDRNMTEVHTVRYEDKFTAPIQNSELYYSFSSFEVDSQCPSHGFKALQKNRHTGFYPKSNVEPYVVFTDRTDSKLTFYHKNFLKENKLHKKHLNNLLSHKNMQSYSENVIELFPKSRKRLKDKYKKILRRKQRSRNGNFIRKIFSGRQIRPQDIIS